MPLASYDRERSDYLVSCSIILIHLLELSIKDLYKAKVVEEITHKFGLTIKFKSYYTTHSHT